MVGCAGEGELVDVGAAAGGPLVDVVDLAPVAGRIAARMRAAAILGVNAVRWCPRYLRYARR
jgi:hypothetical protein